MDAELRARAEARLEQAAATLGLSDPRPAYRVRLRLLREHDPAAFQRAVEHYESAVLPALAEGDAMAAWVDYGRFLASLNGTGHLQTVDESGRASAYEAPPPPHSLVLYMPDEAAEPILALAQPQQPSAAQQATLDLLVK